MLKPSNDQRWSINLPTSPPICPLGRPHLALPVPAAEDLGGGAGTHGLQQLIALQILRLKEQLTGIIWKNIKA